MLLTKSKARETPKEVCRGEIEKSGMDDHIWKEKGNLLKFISNKESNHVWHLNLTRVEKAEVITDNIAPKSYLPLFVEKYYWAW